MVAGWLVAKFTLGSSFLQRWSTAALRHGMPQVTSCANFHTFSVVSSAASPDMSGNLQIHKRHTISKYLSCAYLTIFVIGTKYISLWQ